MCGCSSLLMAATLVSARMWSSAAHGFASSSGARVVRRSGCVFIDGSLRMPRSIASDNSSRGQKDANRSHRCGESVVNGNPDGVRRPTEVAARLATREFNQPIRRLADFLEILCR
jgi:hypothetical protein